MPRQKITAAIFFSVEGVKKLTSTFIFEMCFLKSHISKIVENICYQDLSEKDFCVSRHKLVPRKTTLTFKKKF